MARNVIDWAWRNSRAVNASLIVLLAIVHEADDTGMATIATLELARKVRMSDRSVQIAVRDLVALGELKVCSGGGGRGRQPVYAVLANPEESSGFRPGNPEESSGFRPRDPGNPEESSGFGNPGNPEDSAGFKRHKRRSDGIRPENPEESSGFETSDVFKTSTGIDEVQVKDVPAITSRPDVERLCRHLADRIEANGSRRPTVGKRWHDAARLMLDNDGRSEEQIHHAIDWSQDSEFWRINILSMPKLREKYEQLRLQAARTNGRHTTKDRVRQAAEAGRRVQAMLNGES